MSFRPRIRSIRVVSVAALTALVFGAAVGGCNANRATKVKQPKVLPEKTTVIRVFTPPWYDAQDRKDDDRLVTTAQAVGANQTISESLAINQARQAMALTIDARVDVLQRNFQEQVEAANDLRLLQRFQGVNAIVASHALHGSVVKRKETYLEPNGDYRTFVLMELDDRQVDAAYLDQAKQIDELETRLRSGEAWAELERRAKELRQERANRGRHPLTDKDIQGNSE